MKQFLKHLNLNPGQSGHSIPKLCPDNLVLHISESHHGSKGDLTFNNWFFKFKNVYRKDVSDIPKEKRIRLLLWRLGTEETKGNNHLKELDDFDFVEAVSISFKFLILTNRPDEDRVDYVTRINEKFERSDFKAISNDYFKCLLFLCNLRDSCHANVRKRILNMN